MKSLSHLYFRSGRYIDPTVTERGDLAIETFLNEGSICTEFDIERIIEGSSFCSLQSGHIQLGMIELELFKELIGIPRVNSVDLTIFSA